MSRKQIILVYIAHHPIEAQQLTIVEVPFRQQTLLELRQQLVPGQDVLAMLDGKQVAIDTRFVSPDAKIFFAPAAADPATLWAVASFIFWNVAVPMGLAYLGGLLFGPDMHEPREAVTGSAFQWNPRTTQQEGIPKAMSWGTNMHYGNIVARWTNVDESGDEILYMILDYGGGPVQGRGANPLFINGRSSDDYSGVTVQERLGTLNQTCMAGFEKTKLEYGLSWTVKHDDGPVTFTTPNKFFDDIEFTLCFPKGLWMFHKDGDFEGLPCNVKVEVQEVPLGEWIEVYNETPGGGVMKPIYKAYSVNTLVPGTVAYGHQYDVRMSKVSGDLDHRKACNVLNFRSVREVVDTAFTYPGRALIGISALASEDLSQTLNAKWIADDKLVNVYDGTSWAIEFSRNRAWITFDELTQPVISGDDSSGSPFAIERYDGVDPSMLDVALFYEWAEWCADDVTDGHGGNEERMTCDHVLDYQSSVWDVAHELAQVGRCSLYWQGNTLTGWVDKAVAAADYVDLITFDNVMTKSWRSGWAGYGERAGSVEVFYRDALQGYERKGLPRSNEDAGLYTRVIAVEGTGVTGHALAARVANHALQRNRLIKNVNSVRMYKDALRYRLGNVVRLQSKVPDWGTHYRVVKSEANNTVELDRTCDAEVGDVVFVRSYDEANEKVVIKSYTVESVVDRVVTIVESGGWDPTPVKDNLTAIGVDGAVKTRRIVKMTQSAQNYFDVEFETYDATLFDSDAINPNFNNPDYVWAQPAAALTDPATKQDVLAMIGELLQFQPDIDVPHTSNCTWTGSGGNTVSWSKTDADQDIHFRYKGTSYVIAPDSTTDEFIYWDPAYTTVFRTTNNAAVALAPNMWLMCINTAGVAHPANASQLQHAGVLLAGTIRAQHYLELRNTYVYNAEDSLDNNKPFEVRFKIVSEMIAVVSVKLSFSLMPYRAYSTATASDGAKTSSGGSTWPWGRTGAEDPGDTNSGGAVNTSLVDPGDTYAEDGANNYTEYAGNGGHQHALYGTSHQHTMGTHRHVGGSHSHTMPTHDHLINAPDHTHDITAHTHGITYGLHEEDNAPVTFHYHVHNGVTWSDPSGNYSADATDIDITASITGTGWKAVRFDTDKRCRIAAIIECKLDINA